VDFEQGLNTAMKRLRAALDDNADTPRFIETLPRRGYRFIGSVQNGAKQPGIQARPAEMKPSPNSRRSAIWRSVLVVLVLLAAAVVPGGLNVRGLRERIRPQESKPNIQALAVLPLANLSGDPEQESFADGMTEALITELGKVSSARVISRQSVIQYKDSKKPLQQVARELNVDAVLEGAVDRSGERVRVTIHLSRASPEKQLWAMDYNRSNRDILSLQGEIARTVAEEIRTNLTTDERTRLSIARPVNPDAHDDYLLGKV
jgi:TolB-like protein